MPRLLSGCQDPENTNFPTQFLIMKKQLVAGLQHNATCVTVKENMFTVHYIFGITVCQNRLSLFSNPSLASSRGSCA